MTQLYFIRQTAKPLYQFLNHLPADDAIVLLEDSIYQADEMLAYIPIHTPIYALQVDWEMRGLPIHTNRIQLLPDYSSLVELTAEHTKVITL